MSVMTTQRRNKTWCVRMSLADFAAANAASRLFFGLLGWCREGELNPHEG